MAAFAFVVLVFPGSCLARHRHRDCGSVFCGSLNISYPLRLKNQPPRCGYHTLELECEQNNRTILVGRRGNFSVEEIFYENQTMRVVDAGLNMHDCNSLPRSSFDYNIDCTYPQWGYDYEGGESSIMHVVNCRKPIRSALYIEASRCSIKSNTSSNFYFLDYHTNSSDFDPSCTVEAEVLISVDNISAMSTLDIYNKLSEGLLLTWEYYYYDLQGCSDKVTFHEMLSDVGYALATYLRCNLFYFYDLYNGSNYFCSPYVGVTAGVIILRALLGIPCLLLLVIYKWRRRHLSMDDKIEEFLQNNNLAPIRYSFKEIKKMTTSFKHKLGEGGYGSVFKGKLRSEHHVAVKLLNNSKSNGQDFINEVASIGRIHHANVAKLIGFCVEGSKQALVYDFMSNGSLDKIIFTEENKNTLDDSIVSLTAARGTIGYIAPELVYKNLGGISYKADVYSFGMLLMEMVGRRKNVNAFAEHTSQIYFPSWVYDRLDQGDDMELGDVSEDEKTMVRKMIITAFWCIQLQPADRPSMNKVLKMLESDVELLEMPPKPFHQPPLETSSEVHACESSNNEPSALMDAISITGSNVV
ncbi:hypothetical protein V6N11_068731 [Hibiscus sabdariffa]|uniref:Protein kinase domain-containing protein n=1 Tax=Hibiscus sabdariffa TaxID=183260 RepID=A0ABR2PAK7_9ROSI